MGLDKNDGPLEERIEIYQKLNHFATRNLLSFAIGAVWGTIAGIAIPNGLTGFFLNNHFPKARYFIDAIICSMIYQSPGVNNYFLRRPYAEAIKNSIYDLPGFYIGVSFGLLTFDYIKKVISH